MLNAAGNNCWEFSNHHHHCHADCRIEDEIYTSDEFRMYAYKIKRCPRTRSHDWTECPYAHRGEKAQRRDPRRFRYCAIVCAAFRDSGGISCPKGEACEYAHGVFEYWLHPTKYRTRACNAGKYCQRKVCFFAHSPDQLRPQTKDNKHHRPQFTYRRTAPCPLDDEYSCRDGSPLPSDLAATPDDSMMTTTKNGKGDDVDEEDQELAIGEISDNLKKNLRGLVAGGSGRDHDSSTNNNKVINRVYRVDSDGGCCDHQRVRGLGLDALSSDEELQRLGWISELLD
ncbi:zinc finger CCCH domain-containing protein 20 [Punica granatum]|uniref:C3H1-type domain-containing protein n=2 Tax=Punica granatum TaxID=22663 RepID=A0A218WUR7_PUNGR|nr:zinc finger CCCH domain-containing protein 20 [Punica granatum]OWM75722.1 hypothetical protein CDL15_Pgr021887 [Punica granatum]PKI54554.1 hypothetical protein CRG98_025068 [Punica granatum]